MNKLTMTFAGVTVAATMLVPTTLAQRSGRTQPNSSTQAKQTRRAGPPAPQIGDLAPTVKLKSLDGKQETDISSFRGKRPIILFFGSYT